MAWHDNNWNGTVCQEPEKNHYCIGSRSLLSERLARRRNLEIESQNAGKKLDDLGDYIPPCYWTSNAFSDKTLNIWHDHPFTQYEQTHKIKEKLSGYSVFTWPFKLSFNHDRLKHRRHGSYPPDLDERVKKFIEAFSSGETMIFFYLNYDNPISADENKYVLVGCATLKQLTSDKHFNFEPNELKKIRNKSKTKHFPTMNWAINTSYDFENNGVLLPYKEYLDHIEQNTESSEMLDEMKILIDEESMIPNFKYVASDIDDDSCIYLLTRLRKSFSKVKEHAIVDQKWTNKQLNTIDFLLERAWRLRGVHPGLGNVLDVVGDIDEDRFGSGDSIVKLVQENTHPENILAWIFSLITGKTPVPDYLGDYARIISDIQINIEQYGQKLLQKLSLFSFTQNQISNILNKNEKNFKVGIDLTKVESNPYLLCEEYSPCKVNLDEVFVSDKGIGTFTIDVGMFPNSRFLKRDTRLQNLTPNSPQRLRAIIRDHLRVLENSGDCYAPSDEIYDVIQKLPLFYKEKINLSKDDLILKEEYQTHFKEKMDIVENNHNYYFYLKEIHQAEQLIKDGILTLLERNDHPFEIPDVDEFLDNETRILAKKINDLPKESFISERKRLIEGALKKSLYVISGKPGSGKTQALKKIIDEIRAKGENVTLLAPTGKASLRLRAATGDTGAKTIDRLIYSEGYSDIVDDFENLIMPKDRKKTIIQNLIIDESSMVDLKKLTILFKMITDETGEIWTKRVIFVGDDNQLPPIGYGKPFFDIIQFIRTSKYCESNFVELRTNCRQTFDSNILQVAEIFRHGNRYHEKTLSQITSGRSPSPGFQIRLWKDEDELLSKIEDRLSQVISESLSSQDKIPSEKNIQLNLLLGLNRNGYVQDGSQSMNLDGFQILSPYRGNYFGTLGLNEYIKAKYRNGIHPLDYKIYSPISFTHSDKIISTANQYEWNKINRKLDLVLSNGSMGVVNNITSPYPHRLFFFSDLAEPLEKIKDSEAYELAYAITIHKSQGSEFEHTFVVIPNKKALLSKELVYTALTRSTKQVTLFLQADNRPNILESARRRSDILLRLTSIFASPENYRTIYEPKQGVFVRSKVEYIIFKELENRGIEFEYEKPHIFWQDGKEISIRPDFTIRIGNKEFFLEHLGMLDRQDYSENWYRRKQLYEQNNLGDMLITTDDANGIREIKINKLLNDMVNHTLQETKESKFSLHHYVLY